MKSLLLSVSLAAAAMSTTAQPSVQVAFNVGNCEAHSRGIASLAALDATVPKVMLLDEVDSAVAPWIRQHFQLDRIPGLSFRFVPAERMVRSFSAMGASTVFVLNGADTLLRFPLEELPRRVDEVGRVAQPDTVSGHFTFQELRIDGRQPLSSDMAIATSHRRLWMLDQLLGVLYSVDLRGTTTTSMHRAGSVQDLLAGAGLPFDVSKAMVEVSCIAAVDTITDDPTLVVDCTDTTGTSGGRTRARFYRFAVQLRDDRVEHILNMISEPDEHGVFAAVSNSGYAEQGDLWIAQVLKMWDDSTSYPLFARFTHTGDTMRLKEVAPYDYRKSGHWGRLAPYQVVNGSICGRHFAYALAPLLVDLRNWTEQDLSGVLGLSLDSAMHMPPDYYFTLDIADDEGRAVLLYQSKGKMYMARIGEAGAGRPVRVLIAPPGFDAGNAKLIDRRTVVLLSKKRDALVIGRWGP